MSTARNRTYEAIGNALLPNFRHTCRVLTDDVCDIWEPLVEDARAVISILCTHTDLDANQEDFLNDTYERLTDALRERDDDDAS